MGSITGGGRYDNLTGIFGMPGLSGVGISFGADRIYDVLNALNLYPEEAVSATQLLFINFGEKETAYCLPIAKAAREAGVRTEVYPDCAKMKKQMNYANAKHVAFVVLAGENEIAIFCKGVFPATCRNLSDIARLEKSNKIVIFPIFYFVHLIFILNFAFTITTHITLD